MSQASAPEIPVDLSEEQFGVGIPFETFAALRASQPVYWYEPGNCWVVTSYEHVEKINRDPQRFSSAGGPIPPDDPGHPELPIMLADDPPSTRSTGAWSTRTGRRGRSWRAAAWSSPS